MLTMRGDNCFSYKYYLRTVYKIMHNLLLNSWQALIASVWVWSTLDLLLSELQIQKYFRFLNIHDTYL